MKKTELVEGEMYALGTSGTRLAIPAVLEKLDGQVEVNGRTVKGMIFRQAPEGDGLLRTYMPFGYFVADRLVLVSARGVIERWEPYRERRDVAKARARADQELHGQRARKLVDAVRCLREKFGLTEAQTAGVKMRFPSAVIALDAEVIDELTRRFEPMGVAGSAIEAFVEELHELGLFRGEPELPTLIDIARHGALAKVREGLAVTDAELVVAPVEVA